MCGIIGILGKDDVVERLMEGLRRLEYRGYDSAGIATIHQGRCERLRACGKVKALEALVREGKPQGTVGIGHTRWATHGEATEKNAHPHISDTVAVVHNGIIENFQDLKSELEDLGYHFHSETDTEVAVHLLTRYLRETGSIFQACQKTFSRLKGFFALAAMFTERPDVLIGAKSGVPLVIGYGDKEMYLASDGFTLACLTQSVSYLEDQDWAILRGDRVDVYRFAGESVTRRIHHGSLSGIRIGKDGYRHFMLKEIHEQPGVLSGLINRLISPLTHDIESQSLDWRGISRMTLIACGTAYYAAYIAKYWFESVCGIAVDVEIASEFRYRSPALVGSDLTVGISQSGETLDTLEALRYARSRGQKILAILNVTESSIGRMADQVLPIFAGPEVGVASTKAFTAQLGVLACLALGAAQSRGSLEAKRLRSLIESLQRVPSLISEVLRREESLQSLSGEFGEDKYILYIARGILYPVALEGALKIKEVSYIPCEGHAAGELKHGPLALVMDKIPVVILANHGVAMDKTVSNVNEVRARGGRVILFGDQASLQRMENQAARSFLTPDVEPLWAAIVYAVPLQLLAYYTAIHRGTDVDQPRNLAKTVTVE